MRVRMGAVAVCAVVNIKRRHGDHGEKPLLRAFNRGFHAINDRQLFGREYLSRSGKSANGAVAQHEELVGESSREHQVVNNGKDGCAGCFGVAAGGLHDDQLMSQVERRSGFIEQQHAGTGNKGLRHEDELL